MPDPAALAGTGPRALTERLRVLEAGPARLHLAATRAAGCAGCAARAGCGAAALEGLGRSDTLVLPRPPGLKVAAGDLVEVELPGAALLAAAGLAYLLPVLALVTAVAGALAAGWSDLGTGLAALAALALGALPLLRAERRGDLAAALRIVAVHPAGMADDPPPQACGP